jgi:protein TonB
LASAALHLSVLGVLVVQPPGAVDTSAGRLLPALYLYAPDRRPAVPKEVRIPIPAPPGIPKAASGPVTAPELPGNSPPTPPARQEGLAIPGLNEASFDSVFAALEVDSEVVRYEWSTAPAYPDSLRREGTEGYVEAEFVVDTTGRVDLSTIRILHSSHSEFATSVRIALAGMAFRPAWRGFRKVRQLVGQRFAFRIIRPPVAPTL